MLLLGACVTTEQVKDEKKKPVQWPQSGEVRFKYIATIRSSTDVIEESEEEAFKRMMTGRAMKSIRMTKPSWIAASQGLILVSDTKAKLIHAFDVARRRYFQLGYRLEGKVVSPMGLAIDAQGLIYVVDRKRKTVIVYDRLGLYQRTIGDKGQLGRPSAVGVTPDGSRIYVVDTGGVASAAHKIEVFDQQGEHLKTIGERGGGPGTFNLPTGIAVGPGGNLYVLDAGNFRVQVLDPEGEFLREWGSVGNGYGQFARPKGISVAEDGSVYVVDSAFGNVQVFDPEGRLLLPIGERSEKDRPGLYSLPASVAIDEKGFLYILDTVFKKIDVIQYVGK